MNRLSESSSLYLQQHADNPVDWQPWDEIALDSALKQDKPILLSIGYSACHWCHVMAHESFENPQTAAVMNKLFVNIKVDREERPDLDKLYQLSHQMITGRGGGWPLTVFLDPADLTAFFAGTYFPPQPRYGMPAFTGLLEKLRDWFDHNRESIAEQNQKLREAIQAMQQHGVEGSAPNAGIFEPAFRQLEQRFDGAHGGFGGAPKFPQAPLLCLVRQMAAMDQEFAIFASGMLNGTLRAMALSGLRDHLDGGFFRYTVDGTWTIPHFEKMLYDNAQLLPLYAEAAAGSEKPLFRESAEGIVNWLLSDMHHAGGAFYASIDADADGQEGGFHVWDFAEVQNLLTEDEFIAFASHFGLDLAPNFEGKHWHLVRQTEDQPPLQDAIRKLHAARASRIPPGTDRKILTSWNALCIEGLARAGTALGRDDWVDLAASTLGFIRSRLWKNGRLYAVYADGQARFPAYLDDYAFLLNAAMQLLQARWNDDDLVFAQELADAMLAQFEDPVSGGFYFSAADQDVPVARLRPLTDDATPGGNGVAVKALELLGHLTAESRYLEAAARTLGSSFGDMQQYPLAHATLLCALKTHLRPPPQVVISGPDLKKSLSWKTLITGHNQVDCYVLNPGSSALPALQGPAPNSEDTRAFVCEGLRCMPPVDSVEALQQQLENL